MEGVKDKVEPSRFSRNLKRTGGTRTRIGTDALRVVLFINHQFLGDQFLDRLSLPAHKEIFVV